ncbi:hypothetical protein [Vibrio campbellii]|uniref:hypothetical protein n=1 Tax=Vibrio campbellii TaxID=680 RepID=UPI00210E87AE|nr:hypothetical protein [Vibrio campbellii]UTZ41545.1 hypothetical protein HB764_09165 [Vibrio campbellii]
MNKKFKNVSEESGEITVQVAQTKLSFYVASGAEFTVEVTDNADIVLSSTKMDSNLVIESV